MGFRVLKVDSSNMKDVYYTPDQTSQTDLQDFVSNIKPDRSGEDLLFQVMLELGLELTLPVQTRTLHEKQVFCVAENLLVACFATGITEALVKELAALKPRCMVFKDDGFASDAIKINTDQIFKQISPDTKLRSL